jgi:hypothetical protein
MENKKSDNHAEFNAPQHLLGFIAGASIVKK